jgi:hypothetical protein
MKNSQILFMFVILMVISFSIIPSSFAWHSAINLPKPIAPVSSESGNSDSLDSEGHLTRPTFGLDHENNKQKVDYGFKLNDKKFSLSDNFHTPFVEQTINIGEKNVFEATVYSEKGLHVQEFLFGISQVGDAHLAELGIEVWFNNNGDIEEIRAIQETDVVDAEHILATHEKVKCRLNSAEKECDSTRISVTFLEPLKDKIMAIKAIDYKNRYQITYLNEGIDLSGKSLNPMQSVIIPSPTRNEGPIEITQTEKYGVLWTSDDGRIFERNSFGSFRQIIDSFERFHDSGEPRTRDHSEFGKLIKFEEYRGYNVFNATTLESELPGTFAYSYPDETQRINDEVKEKMLEQEKMAQKIIEESSVQQRFSNINS